MGALVNKSHYGILLEMVNAYILTLKKKVIHEIKKLIDYFGNHSIAHY